MLKLIGVFMKSSRCRNFLTMKLTMARYIKTSIIAFEIGIKKAIPNNEYKAILSQKLIKLVFCKVDFAISFIKQPHYLSIG